MTDRITLALVSSEMRAKAVKWCQGCSDGTRVTFEGPKRTLDQNAAMHAALADIAKQKDYHGIKLSTNDWKLVFLDALIREVRVVPNLDGNGFVSLGRSSSRLSKQEFSDLLDLIYAWGAQHGVYFRDPRPVQ